MSTTTERIKKKEEKEEEGEIGKEKKTGDIFHFPFFIGDHASPLTHLVT